MRSANAMNINRANLQIVQRVASAMRAEDAAGWRAEVEDFITAIGARALLSHVTDAQWDRHFVADDTPHDAVLAELAKVEG